MTDDPHAILGVARGASLEELRAAYRARARELHPDARPDDPTAAEKFRRLREAYQLLRQTARSRPPRPELDRDLGKKRSEARYAPTPFTARPREGSAVSGVVHIPFAASILGGEHLLRIEDAAGSRRRRVTLPPGMSEGQLFRLEGRVVRAKVEPDSTLGRRGEDVTLEVPLGIAELALGARLEVPTVSGPVELVVPPGSPPGRVLRLPGRGVGGVGDQLCVLELAMPDASDPEVRGALERLRAASGSPKKPWDDE